MVGGVELSGTDISQIRQCSHHGVRTVLLRARCSGLLDFLDTAVHVLVTGCSHHLKCGTKYRRDHCRCPRAGIALLSCGDMDTRARSVPPRRWSLTHGLNPRRKSSQKNRFGSLPTSHLNIPVTINRCMKRCQRVRTWLQSHMPFPVQCKPKKRPPLLFLIASNGMCQRIC